MSTHRSDTVPPKSPPTIYLHASPHGLTVRGTVSPSMVRPRVVGYEFENSALTVRALFIDCLRGASVKVNASPCESAR